MPSTLNLSTYKIPIQIDGLQLYNYNNAFTLESGDALPEITIGYHTFGKLNEQKNNVIWVCHALTANSDVSDWWKNMFGEGKIFDPEKHFIVCANILGSCYGSTCARSISPKTQKAYGVNFPLITIRDIARTLDLLRQHLGIREIELCIGGSCGGHQVMEFAYLIPEKIKKIALLVTSARETAWAIATHSAQRLAIQADSTWQDDHDRAGQNGLKAARGIALLGYRTFDSYAKSQTDESEKLDNFKAASYINYQGQKLQNRFFAQCYFSLTKTLDTHHMGRGRGGVRAALGKLKMPAFILSITSDLLIPPVEQHQLAAHLPNANFFSLDSNYGHDGFLVEAKTINELLLKWSLVTVND